MATDREKIISVLRDALAGAGGMLAVRTMCMLIQQWVDFQSSATINDAKILADELASIAENIAGQRDKWIKEGGRFDGAAFEQNFIPDEAQPIPYGITLTLGSTIAQMDNAYGDNFLVAGAQKYLRDVAKYARLFQQEVSK